MKTHLKRWKVIAALYNGGENDKEVRLGDAEGPNASGEITVTLDSLPVLHARWNGHVILVPIARKERKAGR